MSQSYQEHDGTKITNILRLQTSSFTKVTEVLSNSYT